MKIRRSIISALGLFLLFFALAVGLSYTGLDAPMYYDSGAKLEARGHFFEGGVLSAVKLFPQRPLPVLSFYSDYLLTGMWPVHFRLTNLFLWAALCTIVVFFVGMILRTPSLLNAEAQADRKWLCTLAGLAFLVHPLHTYVTLYIWQRMALMACLFYYSALALHLAVRTGKIQNQLYGMGPALVLFVCAVLSKENAVTLPFVILVAEIGLFQQQWRTALKRVVPYLLALLAVLTLISYLQVPHGNERLNAGLLSTLGAYYQESGLSLEEVALTQCRVLFNYLSLIVAPLPWRIQLVSPQAISRSLFDPPGTFVALVGVFALVSIGLYLLKRRPLSGFGILLYVVNLIPEALLVPQYAFFAYRAVLPMLGIYLVFLDGIMALFGALGDSKWRTPVRAGVVGVTLCAVVLMGIASAARASIWGQEVRFWRETVSRFPDKVDRSESRVVGQAFANLGNALYREGSYAEALQWYLKALELIPTNAVARAGLGFVYDKVGEKDKAEEAFLQAIQNDPDLRVAHKGLGDLLMSQNRQEEAWQHLQKALQPPDKSTTQR